MSILLPVPLGQHAEEAVVSFGVRGRVTARQLRARAAGVRQALSEAEGSAVVLACADRLHFSAGLLGAWSLGLEVWLPHNAQPETVESLAADSRVRALLHDRDASPGIDVRGVRSLRRSLPLRLDAERVVAVVHTSGSTGRPIAHEKTWGQLGGETAELLEHFALRGRTVVATVPPHHIYGLLFGVLVPLCGGGRVGRHSPLLPADVARAVAQARAEVLVSVPAQLRALEANALPKHVQVFSSGAPLAERTGRLLRGAGLRVTEVLGSTETGGIASRDADGAAWRCFPQVCVSVGSHEELAVSSPWLPPDAPRPYVCADRVALEADGGFRHLGRADRVVKLGGRRVDLGAVEAALRALPGVMDCRVVAVPSDRLRGVELLAAVEGAGVKPAALRAALRRKLDPVTVPRRFRVLAALPRTGAGKVSDAAVKALFHVGNLPSSLPVAGPADVALVAGGSSK